MKRFFSIYQYAAPAILLPLGYILWLGRYDGNHTLVVLTLSVPILFAYVIPGIGTNVLKLWEFDTRLKLGKFRPHHGFVFGTATGILAYLSTGTPPQALTITGTAQAAFVMASVLGFWNWLYDYLAIKAGFIIMYEQPYYKDLSPAALAAEHAPVIFGVFGATYGTWLYVAQYLLSDSNGATLTVLLLAIGCAACLTLPIFAFAALSYYRYGVSGLVAMKREKS